MQMAFSSYGLLYSKNGLAEDIAINAEQIIDTGTDRYFIISVGVNIYQDKYWPTLKWSANDAELVSNTLGKGTKHNIIKKQLVNEAATLSGVYSVLKEVAEQSTPDDTVILYISGHGTLSQAVTGELQRLVVLHDTVKDQLSTTGLPHSMLHNWLNNLKARKKMMIFATCHSGEGKSRLPPEIQKILRGKKGDLIPLAAVSQGALVFAAAAQGEAAYENDKLGGDIYTYYFLEAIQVNDRNKDGMVSALEAHDYARDRTWRFTNGRQRPTVWAKLIGDADISLSGSRKNSGLPVLQAYEKEMSGLFVQIDQSTKGMLPTAFPLNPQGSEISLYGPGRELPIARYYVTVPAGHAITLENVMNKRLFNIGISLRHNYWSDGDWKKIPGNISNNTYTLNGGYNFKRLGIGLSADFPKYESGVINDSIISNTVLKSMLFYASFSKRYKLFNLSARIEYGLATMEIALADQSSGQELKFEDTSNVQGVALTLAYNFALDLNATFEIGYRNTDWKFDTIGSLSGERKWVGIGVGYRFDWNSSTLW